MSFKYLYPLTGSMMMIGLMSFCYGIQVQSLTMSLEGLILMVLSFRITISIWEALRLEDS